MSAELVSERDRAKMRTLGDDLAAGESDRRGTAAERQAILEAINADRRHAGRDPLTDKAPEEGLHERARSLGMARVDR